MDRAIARQMLLQMKLDKVQKQEEERLRDKGKHKEEQRMKKELEEEERLKLEMKQKIETRKERKIEEDKRMKVKLTFELGSEKKIYKQLLQDKAEIETHKLNIYGNAREEENRLTAFVKKEIHEIEEKAKIKMTRSSEKEKKIRQDEDKKISKLEEAEIKGTKKGTKLEEGLAETRRGLYMKTRENIASRRDEKEKEQFYELKGIYESIEEKRSVMEEGLEHIQEKEKEEESALKVKENCIDREIRKTKNKMSEIEKTILSLRV